MPSMDTVHTYITLARHTEAKRVANVAIPNLMSSKHHHVFFRRFPSRPSPNARCRLTAQIRVAGRHCKSPREGPGGDVGRGT
jgi:hypothetical protein